MISVHGKSLAQIRAELGESGGCPFSALRGAPAPAGDETLDAFEAKAREAAIRYRGDTPQAPPPTGLSLDDFEARARYAARKLRGRL